MHLKQFIWVKAFALDLSDNQEEQAVTFPNHCSCVLKIIFFGPSLQMKWAGIGFFFNFIFNVLLFSYASWHCISASLIVVSKCVCSLSSCNTENMLVAVFTFLCCGGESFIVLEIEREQWVSVLVEMNEEQYHIHAGCKHQLRRFLFFFKPSDCDSCSGCLETTCKPN